MFKLVQAPPRLRQAPLLLPTLGPHPAPAFSWRFKAAIKDSDAFRQSLQALLALPIQRIIPGHGEVLESDAKARARSVFEKRGPL